MFRMIARISATSLLLAVYGCGGTEPIDQDIEDNKLGTTQHALHVTPIGEVIPVWVEEGFATVRVKNLNTGAAGRFYAMLTGAMYDAVNGIDRARGGRREHAIVSPDGAVWYAIRPVAAAAAARAVLLSFAPERLATYDALLAQTVDAWGGASSPLVAAGLSYGEAVGAAVIAARAADGTQAAVTLPAGTAIGQHRASFDSRFRNQTPFGIASKTPYVSAAPPTLTSDEYTAAYNEVKTLGVQDGDPERNAISNFWLAEGGTVRETGTWMQATARIVRDRRTVLSISATARVFARVGMAMADGNMVASDTKAIHFTWRPTVAIREGDLDGNPATVGDAAWVSRINTPGGSPEWTSGTSTFAGAASVILANFYGRNLDFCFQTDGATAGERCYDSPEAGAAEAGQSRIIQGIHFQFSNQEGQLRGRQLGSEITRRLR